MFFTTPLSPHQGGIYESLIKQAKRAMRVAIGKQVLSWNEMATVFAEVKSLANGRPLGYPSDDPNDLQPLTPNHFLFGRASLSVPHGTFQRSEILSRRFQFGSNSDSRANFVLVPYILYRNVFDLSKYCFKYLFRTFILRLYNKL